MKSSSNVARRGASSAWNSVRSAPTPITAIAASSPVTAEISACTASDQAWVLRAPARAFSTRYSKCIGVGT